jgi:hypothetical protein
MTLGTWMQSRLAFKSSVYPLTVAGFTISGYSALWALAANVGVVVVASAVLNAAGVARGQDATRPDDYGE